MTWLTWRQSRLESLIGGAALALVAVFMLWTGHTMIASYHDLGLPACVASHGGDGSCQNAVADFLNRFGNLDGLVGWLNLLPFLLGLLLATPTLLDLEQGTYRLAWTQSVTRRRWLAAKIGYGLVVAAVVSAALVALWSWWRGPFDAIDGRLNGNGFDLEGTVPFAYVVFSFAVCLAIGTVLRRTVPALGIGLVVYLVARLGVISQLRPHYLNPIKLTWDPTDPTPAAAVGRFGDGSWIIDQGFSATGGRATIDNALRDCAGVAGGGGEKRAIRLGADDAFNRCLHDHSIVNTLVYHPASRFWTFQGFETALFLGVSAILLAVTVWWVLRRIA
ncbi:MAG TPA: hypothetical protein VH482_38065 [Thermomicrobiales bacterium]|jgi:hypothetical protein